MSRFLRSGATLNLSILSFAQLRGDLRACTLHSPVRILPRKFMAKTVPNDKE